MIPDWDAFETKTARFICDHGSYIDVIFDGDVCPVPILSNTRWVRVGVFAGNLSTTTPAQIVATNSILSDGGIPADPPPDVYNQLMEKLNMIDSIEDISKNRREFYKIITTNIFGQ